MINVAVYGTLKWSLLMRDLLENEYSAFLKENGGEDIKVCGFIATTLSGNNEEITFDDFLRLYKNGEISAIIIPKEYYLQYNVLLQNLIKGGVNLNDIFNGVRLDDNIRNNKDKLHSLITPMLSDSYLPYLEYHVLDHCNLNCKYCTHYSPLVDEPVFTDYNRLTNDLGKLKEKIDDIGVIRLLGGEPLLNPELPDYIEYTRRLYPHSIITVVSNGLIIDKISKELIRTMQKNVAFFHISYYPPIESKIDDIKKFLVDNNIGFTVSPKIDSFNKMQLLEPSNNEDFFYDCVMGTCTCLHEGKISPCYVAFMTKYFNKAFAQNLPEDEGIDLYDDSLTTEDLKLKLVYPLKRCLYCDAGSVEKWEIVGKKKNIEDWVITNNG